MIGIACVIMACLLGIHLNRLVTGVTFLIFGSAVIFIGILYMIPPLSFFRRAGGEIILAYGMGMLPVLGAYLVQADDLTRKVYMVSLPFVAATGLWIWLERLANRTADSQAGHGSLIELFGLETSCRYITPVLVIILYVSLLLAVLSGACSPLAGIAVLSVYFAFKIINISWRSHRDEQKMRAAIKHAIILHLILGISIIVSSLVVLIT
jgi:1,4-dihydroxy-2-naphthoate octaprenyltransferase